VPLSAVSVSERNYFRFECFLAFFLVTFLTALFLALGIFSPGVYFSLLDSIYCLNGMQHIFLNFRFIF